MKDKQRSKTELYKQIVQPSNTITKDNFELQPNQVTMDTNPAYESCK